MNNRKAACARNFGMARPKAIRKAIRLMDLADRLPGCLLISVWLNTPGDHNPAGRGKRRGAGESQSRGCTQNACRWGFADGVGHQLRRGGGGGGGVPGAGAGAVGTGNETNRYRHCWTLSVYFGHPAPRAARRFLWKDAEKMREAREPLRADAQEPA